MRSLINIALILTTIFAKKFHDREGKYTIRTNENHILGGTMEIEAGKKDLITKCFIQLDKHRLFLGNDSEDYKFVLDFYYDSEDLPDFDDCLSLDKVQLL